jgi:hypothetical protein
MPPPVVQTVTVRASRRAVLKVLRRLPRTAATSLSGPAKALLTRIGLTALGRIRRAFVVKSRGGTDEAGERWAPLQRSTIAYSRRHREIGRQGQTLKRYLPRGSKRAPFRPSYALTPAQRRRWWAVYARHLAKFNGNKSHAASVAWLTLKAEGAHTLIELYGGASVEILRDTGLLLTSLSPGVDPSAYTGGQAPQPKASKGTQVFRLARGAVIVGTNRKGAAAHHAGVPGRLPMRRLWPLPSRWPSLWWTDLLEASRLGLVEIALAALNRGP